MEGESSWLTLMVVVASAAALGILALVSRLSLRRFQGRLNQLNCPKSGQLVDVVRVFDAITGCWTGIQSCSGRKGGASCAMTCLQSREEGRPQIP